MTKLTIEQDMKLGAAQDQLEDAIEAVYATLKMVQWARLTLLDMPAASSLRNSIRK
jgi:hypothetical protein